MDIFFLAYSHKYVKLCINVPNNQIAAKTFIVKILESVVNKIIPKTIKRIEFNPIIDSILVCVKDSQKIQK